MGMEEKKDVFENIKIINTLYKEGAHLVKLNDTKSVIKGVSIKISDKARLLATAKKEEALILGISVKHHYVIMTKKQIKTQSNLEVEMAHLILSFGKII